MYRPSVEVRGSARYEPRDRIGVTRRWPIRVESSATAPARWCRPGSGPEFRPGGYGKTVLLAEWVRGGRHPVAWLSLDPGDNDPARFWRHAVAALDRVRPGITERLGPLLGPPAPPSFEPLVTALINEVADQPDTDEALLLVLDDYHVISSQLVHESLGFLLAHRPPGLVPALTSRSDPPLALARLRARGQLTELRAAELRFTSGEAAALLAQV